VSHDAAAVPSHQAALLTISETARRTGVSRRQIRNAVAGNDIKPVFIGNRVWIPAAEAEAFRRRLHPEVAAAWCGHAVA
jgi:excisionase family DNA binding protein